MTIASRANANNARANADLQGRLVQSGRFISISKVCRPTGVARGSPDSREVAGRGELEPGRIIGGGDSRCKISLLGRTR